MGNAACGGTRVKPSKASRTQNKLQELMAPITLQLFENKIKIFAQDGKISVRQLDEVLLSGLRHLYTKNNTLLRDILTNPFFHLSKGDEDNGDNDDEISPEIEKDATDPASPPKDEVEKEDAGDDKPEEEGGEADAVEGAEEDREPKDNTKDQIKNVTIAGIENPNEESIVSETASVLDFPNYNKLQREQKDNFQPATTVKAKPPTDETEEDVTQNIFLSVEKLVLFAILYGSTKADTAFGNQHKALAFFHLMNQEDVAANVRKNSKRLKKLMYSLFELAQARLRTDPDGIQRIYFREKSVGAGEDKHQLLIQWFYEEFQRQIFGRRVDVSCIQFIERMSCIHNKNKFSNVVDKTTLLWHNEKRIIKAETETEEGDGKYDNLTLPQLSTMSVNDWFDPEYLQSRIEFMRSKNEITSEVGSVSADSLHISEGRE